MLRLFETGRREEDRLVRDLRRTGATVLDIDPETGRQWRVDAHGGHFGGSLDAVAIGLLEAPKTWHVVEFKTHGLKSFTVLKQGGVAPSKPQHWAQMQIYMHLTGITRALYVAVCKDTDELHIERTRADGAERRASAGEGARVIDAARPPSRIAEDPAWWRVPLLQPSRPSATRATGRPSVTCRSCLHATPVEGGWHLRALRPEAARSRRRSARGCPKPPVRSRSRARRASSTPATIGRLPHGRRPPLGRWRTLARRRGVMLTLRPYQQAAIDGDLRLLRPSRRAIRWS